MQQISFYAVLLGLLAVGPAVTQQSPPDDKAAPGAQGDIGIRDSVGRRLDSVTAEIVNENRPAEKDLNLLARLEVQPNEIIEFYEPKPGQILISGAGAPDSPSRLTRTLQSPMEAWRQVAPGFDMPPALREAIKRWRKVEPTSEKGEPEVKQEWGGGSPEKAEGQAPPEPRKQAKARSQYQSFRSGGWCDTGYFSDYWGRCPTEDFKVCLDNWWNGAFAEHHDASYAWTAVCPATGSVALRLSSNEHGDGLWTVAQDTMRWWSGRDSACYSVFDDCPFVRADVEQAAGDRFHFRFGAMDE